MPDDTRLNIGTLGVRVPAGTQHFQYTLLNPLLDYTCKFAETKQVKTAFQIVRFNTTLTLKTLGS